MFKLAICDQWMRIKPQGDEVTVFTKPRPHIVPTNDQAEKIVIVDSTGWIGHTGLCPGKVFYEGKWVFAYRFKFLSDQEAERIIGLLTEDIKAIERAARD